jgi:hypothetical protein
MLIDRKTLFVLRKLNQMPACEQEMMLAQASRES